MRTIDFLLNHVGPNASNSSRPRQRGRAWILLRLRNKFVVGLVFATFLCTSVAVALRPRPASASETTPLVRVSVASNGQQGNGRSDYDGPAALSGDGRFVVFASRATNLVPDDTNGTSDVFRRDLQTGTTIRVSVAADGTQGDNYSGANTPLAITPDGRYVAFASFASNFVAGDTNGYEDIFVKDLQTGTVTRASVASDGTPASRGAGQYLSLSADGQRVLFMSSSPELDPAVQRTAIGPYPNYCFLHDLETGTTSLAQVDNAGVATYYPQWCTLSPDGNVVAFQGGWPGQPSGIYLRNLATQVTSLAVEFASNCGPGGSFQGCTYAGYSLSADGRYLAFMTNAPNLTSQSIPTCALSYWSGNCAQVYVADTVTGRFHLVSATDDTGAIADSQSWLVDAPERAISADGRYVAFSSRAQNLKAQDGGEYEIYRHDVHTGRTVQLTTTTDTSGHWYNSSHLYGAISPDGSSIVFTSKSPDLVANDTNEVGDIFVVGHPLSPGDGDGFPTAPSTGWSVPGPTDTYGAQNPALTTRACSAGDPVNLATGNFYETVSDLDVRGRGRPLHLERTYNALAAAGGSDGRLGRGWTDS